MHEILNQIRKWCRYHFDMEDGDRNDDFKYEDDLYAITGWQVGRSGWSLASRYHQPIHASSTKSATALYVRSVSIICTQICTQEYGTMVWFTINPFTPPGPRVALPCKILRFLYSNPFTPPRPRVLLPCKICFYNLYGNPFTHACYPHLTKYSMSSPHWEWARKSMVLWSD